MCEDGQLAHLGYDLIIFFLFLHLLFFVLLYIINDKTCPIWGLLREG